MHIQRVAGCSGSPETLGLCHFNRKEHKMSELTQNELSEVSGERFLEDAIRQAFLSKASIPKIDSGNIFTEPAQKASISYNYEIGRASCRERV